MKKTMYFQLRTFVGLAKHAKVAAAFDMKNGIVPKGLFKEDLLNADITEDTFNWLVLEHYISYHEGRCLFIAFANKYYPDKTIDNLVEILDEFEKEILKK